MSSTILLRNILSYWWVGQTQLLCKTYSVSYNCFFQVDASPPSVGTFAVGTESAANLERHHIIWITPTEAVKPTESTVLSTSVRLRHHNYVFLYYERVILKLSRNSL